MTSHQEELGLDYSIQVQMYGRIAEEIRTRGRKEKDKDTHNTHIC
jgi:hypothetical protein